MGRFAFRRVKFLPAYQGLPPFPLLPAGVFLVNSEFNGQIACRCDTISIIADKEISVRFCDNFAHSDLTAVSASITRACILCDIFEFARE